MRHRRCSCSCSTLHVAAGQRCCCCLCCTGKRCKNYFGTPRFLQFFQLCALCYYILSALFLLRTGEKKHTEYNRLTPFKPKPMGGDSAFSPIFNFPNSFQFGRRERLLSILCAVCLIFPLILFIYATVPLSDRVLKKL